MPNIDGGTYRDKSGSTDHPFEVTFFFHKNARYKHEVSFTLESLAGQIETEEAEAKDQLKWLKLAHFGAVVSKDGSLRHNDNVQWVTGCEGDYDQGKMGLAEAIDRLDKAGLAYLLYTTPSHTPDAPRWRVLCPFSERLAPEQRSHMVARLNGVLGGVLADESFTLSQSYYFGHLSSASAYAVRWSEGSCIDTCDELDVGAIGKGRREGDGGNGQDHAWSAADIEELTRRILSGETLHPSVVAIAGSYAGRGIDISACLDYVALAFTAAHQPRYGGRWDECVAAVTWCYAREEKKRAKQAPPRRLNWADIGWDDAPVPEQQWTVRDRIPASQPCLLSGHGGTGKSSIGLYLCAAHALGRDWLYSMPVLGGAWFIDAEDSLDVLHYRTAAIVKHYGCKFSDLVDGGLRLLPMAGEDMVLATVDKKGKVEPTQFYNALLEEASDLKPVQIVLASAADVFAGNENDRVQVQQFVGMLRRICLRTGGSLVLVSHPSLTGLSTGTGISGTTQWHNAFRARIVLNGEDDPELRKLEFLKNQYGPRGESITLRWKDGMFLPEAEQSSYERAARDAKVDGIFMDLMADYQKRHQTMSPNQNSRTWPPSMFSKEKAAAGIKRAELEQAMRRLLEKGSIVIKTWGPPSKRHEYVCLPD